MFNMNLSVVLLTLGGCGVYVCSMSALGRWLASCRDACSEVAGPDFQHGLSV
jgi:hypothetical protein